MRGKLCIGRVSSTRGQDYISVRITDEKSRIEFAQLDLSLEKFARAITGTGFMEGELTIRGLDLVGKTYEYKTELVPYVNKDHYYTKEKDGNLVKKALAPFEVDGWKADESDMYNHHRYFEEGVQVGFYRWVTK